MLVIRFPWGCGHLSWRVDFDSRVRMATSTSPAHVYFCLCYTLSLISPPRLAAAEGTEPRFMREEEEESSEEEDELTPEAQGGACTPPFVVLLSPPHVSIPTGHQALTFP